MPELSPEISKMLLTAAIQQLPTILDIIRTQVQKNHPQAPSQLDAAAIVSAFNQAFVSSLAKEPPFRA
jgi:hypothetical protein